MIVHFGTTIADAVHHVAGLWSTRPLPAAPPSSVFHFQLNICRKKLRKTLGRSAVSVDGSAGNLMEDEFFPAKLHEIRNKGLSRTQ